MQARRGAAVVPGKLTFEYTCVIVIIIMKTRDNERMGWTPLFRANATKEQREREIDGEGRRERNVVSG